MNEPSFTQWHLRAAARRTFSPADLTDDPTETSKIVRALRADIAVVKTPVGPRWTLKRSVRTAVLQAHGDEIAHAPDTTGPMGQALRGAAPDLDSLDAAGLAEVLEAAWALQGTRYARSIDTLRTQALLGRQRILEPFEALIGDHFRGRTSELRTLNGFLNRSGVTSFLKKAGGAPSPLTLHGPGGVGKTSLLARFLLDHGTDDNLPFVYLDFDRLSVSAHRPASLLAEAARQLADQYAPLRSIAATLEMPLTVPRFLRLFEALETSSDPAEWGPFLVVLDTFEEAEYRTQGDLAALWSMLDELMQAHPGVRVVISGRARPQLPWDSWTDLELQGFDPESAQGFLMYKGVPEVEAAAIAARFGGNPLTLSLAARLAIQGQATDVQTRGMFWLRLDEATVQGYLVKRILEHVHDDDVRKLAHPGMVLRRVDAAILQHVLAEPCGIEVPNEAAAVDLFKRLRRETALVSVAEEGVLVHRSDVRRVMLNLLLRDQPETAQQIRTRFVTWIEARIDPTWRAEELLQRYWLGHSDAVIESRWIEGVHAYLEQAVFELPPPARARLTQRIHAARSAPLSTSKT